MDREQTIERLRTSKQECEDEARRLGEEAGKEWAHKDAAYDELLRLADAAERVEQLEYSPSHVADVITHSEEDETDFWVRAAGEGAEITPAFVRGFVAGALAVWEEVEDDL